MINTRIIPRFKFAFLPYIGTCTIDVAFFILVLISDRVAADSVPCASVADEREDGAVGETSGGGTRR